MVSFFPGSLPSAGKTQPTPGFLILTETGGRCTKDTPTFLSALSPSSLTLGKKDEMTRDLVPRQVGQQHKQEAGKRLQGCDSTIPVKPAAAAGSHIRQQDLSVLGVSDG